MTDERWAQIPGFPGYSASTLGRIASLKRLPRKVLKPFVCNGYHRVCLMKDGKRRPSTAHYLVALAFLGPAPEGMRVRHLDNDRGNSRLDNLCYDTPSAIISHGKHSLSPEDVVTIRARRASGESLSDIAKDYPVGDTNIWSVCAGKTYKHFGGPITPPGTISVQTKLTREDVWEIRLMLKEGVKQADIASKFGVHGSTITNIKTGRTWRNV